MDSRAGDHAIALFEPDGVLNEKGLYMTDAAVEARPGQPIALIIENESLQPVWLKKGQVLGTVSPANLVEWSDEEPESSMDGGGCGEAPTTEVKAISVETSKSQQDGLAVSSYCLH